MCNGSDRASFYMCTSNRWIKMKCDRNTVCAVRHDKALCVDRDLADAPVQPCLTAKATRCVPDNKKVFQTCIDGFWTNSTCAGSDHAEMYQVCTNKLWANFTCDGTNVCRMNGDKAVCGDKDGTDAPPTMATLHAPTAYRAAISSGAAARPLYAWSLGALFGAVTLALSAGL
ncbi:hypothetical protein IWQ57_002445 [Coemansia nantahalensis]|uniref:Uncharacterized protein n=1 Tax=Coemansia nantahalensis TaxID=2789366 RepID=A0ACC1K066_9FUNG|nr:hypothetical protein IWQ57_002445 [Coemansia nantahalensis]